MELQRIKFGTINFPDGKVDCTDPCYDKTVWCRERFEIKAGKYNCYFYKGQRLYGDRIWICQIVFAEGEDAIFAEEKIAKNKGWQKVGEIGVDAGLAGFFNNKPDFSDEEWHDLCAEMLDVESTCCSAYIKHFDTGDGFWTDSGVGDGSYGVYAIRNNGKVVALEIRFYEIKF